MGESRGVSPEGKKQKPTSICLCQIVDEAGCLNRKSLQTKLKYICIGITDFEVIVRMSGVDCLIITSYGISSKKTLRCGSESQRRDVS